MTWLLLAQADAWGPDAVVTAALKIGIPAALAGGLIWLIGKYADVRAAKWGNDNRCGKCGKEM